MARLSDREIGRMKSVTVDLPERGGRGVMMCGGLILTAVHCLALEDAQEWATRSALGDRHVEKLIAPDGREFRAEVLAADIVSDLAVLGSLDMQDAPDEAALYEDVVGPVAGLSLWSRHDNDVEALQVWARSASGGLVTAEVDLRFRSIRGDCKAASRDNLDRGSSGGPVVDERGRLLGLVRHSFGEPLDGWFRWPLVLASEALPQWTLGELRREV